MSPSLEDLPNEVIDSIAALSNLRDICSLGLCSRTLATKATQTHFKSYFLSRHVNITDTSLREFVHLTKPGWLGCLIQHLVLVGVVNNARLVEADLRENSASSEADDDRKWMTKAQQDLYILKQRQIEFQQMHGSGTDVSLISEAFRNIAANGRLGRLLSLSLEVVYFIDAEERIRLPFCGGWGLIWKLQPIHSIPQYAR
jgi:hypothetical protein